MESAARAVAVCAGDGRRRGSYSQEGRGIDLNQGENLVEVIGPPDPAVQLQLCAGLEAPADAENCLRGTKVQNLLGRSTAVYVELIGRCELFAGATRAACYRWLGKTLAVLTDGVFARTGCPQLAHNDARRQCRAGARRLNEALVTFS